MQLLLKLYSIKNDIKLNDLERNDSNEYFEKQDLLHNKINKTKKLLIIIYR